MSFPAPRHHYTFEEYLELEEVSRVRHEYYHGEIYAMAGGTPEHAAITAAVTAMLVPQFAGTPCRVYSSDLRVRVLPTGLATYPDVTVVCGPSERDPLSVTHITNPKLLVEVLSPSTAEYDRGEKLLHYQQIAALSAVLLIDPSLLTCSLWTREESGWQCREFASGSVIAIAHPPCELNVDALLAAAAQA